MEIEHLLLYKKMIIIVVKAVKRWAAKEDRIMTVYVGHAEERNVCLCRRKR